MMFREFFADIRSQKLRTALTVLGIAWGTVAVVVLLAFGVGLERQTKKRFHGLGDRIVVLFGGRTTKAFAGFPNGREISITEADANLLRQEVAEISQISPEYIARGTKVRRGIKAANPAVTGILPVYGEMRNIIPQAGGAGSTTRMWPTGGGWRCWAMNWPRCCSRTPRRSGSRSISATRPSS